MFGKIELRNTWLVLGICCVITFIVIFMLTIFTKEEDTSKKRGYSTLLNFSLYTILLPGILFFIVFYYLYSTDPKVIRAGKLATAKKVVGGLVAKPAKKKAPPANNNSNDDDD
jgi:uncharacterized BrkB/YihY/UPF0761 family membrane protein